MSSTNRGGDRHVSDYYVTPQAEITRFLNRFVQREQYAMSRTILDPCAGGTATDEMSYPAALREFGCPGPGEISRLIDLTDLKTLLIDR